MATAMTDSAPLLTVERLSVDYPARERPVQALVDISLDMRPAEILGLMGQSGSGKSTLALAIAGLLPASCRQSGSVRLDGRELTGLADKHWRGIRGRYIAMVFQNPVASLNPVRTVGWHMQSVIRRHLGVNHRQARLQSIDWLERLGVANAEKRLAAYPHHLSGGTCQRVMLAMAMSCRPQLLIADEPTSALDVTTQASILEQILNLRDQWSTAVLMISHDPGVMARVADQVIVLDDGRIAERQPATRLFERPGHPVTRKLLKPLGY